jgi:FkbM family methyltransferase
LNGPVKPRELLSRLAGRFGYDVRRLDAARRTALLHHHGVDLVLDVGAAKGTYGRELRRFGYTGKIVSFEPLDAAFDALASAAHGDSEWHVVKTAIGEVSRNDTIHIAANGDSSSLLNMLDKHRDVAPHTEYVGTQPVQVRRLDDLAFEQASECNAPFMKVDTQGYERAVLNGARDVVQLLRGVQIELSFVPLYEDGMLFDEAIERLLSEGFQLQGLEPGFRDPRSQQLLQADGIFFRS